MRDGILNHTGPDKPATLEGRVVRLVDRVAYINHDIDDAVRAGIIDARRPAGRRDRAARADRGGAGSTRSCATSSRPRASAATSRSRDEVGGAMLRLRKFMFESVYLGAGGAQRSTSGCTARCSGLFDHYLDAPGRSRRTPGATKCSG